MVGEEGVLVASFVQCSEIVVGRVSFRCVGKMDRKTLGDCRRSLHLRRRSEGGPGTSQKPP